MRAARFALSIGLCILLFSGYLYSKKKCKCEDFSLEDIVIVKDGALISIEEHSAEGRLLWYTNPFLLMEGCKDWCSTACQLMVQQYRNAKVIIEPIKASDIYKMYYIRREEKICTKEEKGKLPSWITQTPYGEIYAHAVGYKFYENYKETGQHAVIELGRARLTENRIYDETERQQLEALAWQAFRRHFAQLDAGAYKNISKDAKDVFRLSMLETYRFNSEIIYALFKYNVNVDEQDIEVILQLLHWGEVELYIHRKTGEVLYMSSR
jgi:hypothetical protein